MMRWIRLHAHALGDALHRLGAQPVASLASVLVLAMAIALPVVAVVILKSAGLVTKRFDTDPHANVYLVLDAGDEDVKRVERALRSSPDAASVRFIPREQALAELKANTHLAELLSSMDGNPLPHAFAVRLRTVDAARLEADRKAWAALPKVDRVATDFEWSQRLGRWLRFADRVVLGIGVLLAAAVAFIVGHLIRLQVVSRRDEIEVSRLIGATARDVRRPFLYHGFVEGLLAGIGALAVATGVWLWLGHELSALTPEYAAELKLVFLDPTELAMLVLATAVVGWAGAWFAVSRELDLLSRRR